MINTRPVQLLFHGTGVNNSALIAEQGLIKKNHEHVYLTTDLTVAYEYAKKFESPVICIVDAPAMYSSGFTFYKHNEEWLVDAVPKKFVLQILVEDDSDLGMIWNAITHIC